MPDPNDDRQRIIRLLRRIDYSAGPNGCWIWTGGTSGSGHATVNWRGKARGVYRVIWQLIYGPLPSDLHLDHLCMNPRCVNPLHLEPVSPSENLRRAAVAYGRHSAHGSVCVHGHAMGTWNIYVDPAGRAHCRTCRRATQLRAHHRNYIRRGNFNEQKTHCKRGHEYTPENTYAAKNGTRSCKTCRRAAAASFYQKKKLAD